MQYLIACSILGIFGGLFVLILVPGQIRRIQERGFAVPSISGWVASRFLKRVIWLELEVRRLKSDNFRKDQRILALEDDKADLERRHLDVLRGAL